MRKLLALAFLLLPLAAEAQTTITGPITFSTGLAVTGATVTATGASLALACGDLTNDGTACTANTGTSGTALPFLDGTNTWSGTQTFGTTLGTIRTITGTTHTLEAADCGKTLLFTNGSPIALTTLNSILPGCPIAVEQGGAGAVTVGAGAGSTLQSATGTYATSAQYNIIGLFVDTNSGGSAANVVVTGAGALALANYNATPSNPATTTSTTGVMAGLAGAITPTRTGKVLLTITGSYGNGTAARGSSVKLRYGTGTAPGNGDALTGTAIGNNPILNNAAANHTSPFAATSIITGLSVGVAYWLDLEYQSITSGTTSMYNVTITAVEQP